MKNRLFISEEEKNRILNLHKKQILKETTNHNSKLIREQEEKEIERLLALLDPNDPDPIKWQDIVNKIEAMGEDVITYIRKMKDKELAKKFGRWLKNNFNKVKFQQAADNVVSFFKNLGKKKPTPGPTPTPEPTPPPTPTPTEDPNAWKEDYDKQKEWLLLQGFTEEDLQMFEKNRNYVNKIFAASYYEEPQGNGEINKYNIPKTMEQLINILTKYGFKKFEKSDLQTLINKPNRRTDPKGIDYLDEYLKDIESGFNTSVKNMWFNPKNWVLVYTNNVNSKYDGGDRVNARQLNFKNNRTDQTTNTEEKLLFIIPPVNKQTYDIKLGFYDQIDNFMKYVINPTVPDYEEYEDLDSVTEEIEYVRTWWFENGRKKFDFIDGETWGIDEKGNKTKIYDKTMRGPLKEAITKNIVELENMVKMLKDDELKSANEKLEQLKNEARRLQFYE